MNRNNGLIFLEDFPEDEWIYLGIDGIIRNLLQRVIYSFSDKIRGSFNKLSKLTELKVDFLHKLHRGNRRKIKISHLKIFLSFLIESDKNEFWNKINNEITRVGYQKSIINPRIPIDFATSEGAIFLGDLLTDGSINSNYQVTYSNSNLDRIIKNLQNTHKLFTGSEIKIPNTNSMNNDEKINLIKKMVKKSKVRVSFFVQKKKYQEKKYETYQLFYSNLIGKILTQSLGIPRGRRVYTNPSLPDFILNRGTSFPFLGRIFSNEGHVENFGISICHGIDVTKHIDNLEVESYESIKSILEKKKRDLCPNLLWDYIKILKLVGCNNINEPYVAGIYKTQKNEIHTKWNLFLSGDDVKLLFKNSNFDDDFKKKVEDYFRKIKFTRLPRSLRLKQILETGKECQENHGFFTVNIITDKTNLDNSTVQKYLKRAKENNLISFCGKFSKMFKYRCV